MVAGMSHSHAHADAHDDPAHFTQEFWDDRYASAGESGRIWSGQPNPQLVAQTADLAPGEALEAGCGEGADAIWLARRGWRVTAVDISGVALDRAAAHAAAAGDDVAGLIRWQRADLLETAPPERAYDLVTAQYLQLPTRERRALYRSLAAAVADGGTLLIVGHHPADMGTTMPRPQRPELFFTGDDLAAELSGAGWKIVTNVAAPREATDPEGRPVTIHDTVFRARRGR